MERSAVALTRTHLLELEEISRSLLDCTLRLDGHEPLIEDARPRRHATQPRVPRLPRLDPERLSVAVLVMVSQWASFLLWVYVDTPGHQALFQLVPTFAMAFGPMAFVRPSTLAHPFLVSGSVMGLVYVFIMPRLTGFLELGTMIFLLMFGIGMLYSAPAKGLSRLAGFITFLSLLGIDNQQNYDFASFANSLLMLFLAISMISLVSSFRFSRRPEQALRRVFMRFSREGARALQGLRMNWSGGAGSALPDTEQLRDCSKRLHMWSQHVDPTIGVDPQDLERLANTAGSLCFRMEALANTEPSATPELVQDQLQRWHAFMEQRLQDYGVGRLDTPMTDLRRRLDRDIEEFDVRLEQLDDDALSDVDRLSLYQLMGSYRSLAEGMTRFVTAVDEIPWPRMREPRF